MAPPGRVTGAGHPTLRWARLADPMPSCLWEGLMLWRWERVRRALGVWRRLGWLRKRKPSPASVPAPEASRRWAAMTGQKGILLEALEAEGEAGVKHR